MALAAALAAVLLAAHVPDVSAALSAWRLQTKNAFILDIGGTSVSVPATKIIDPGHVPYILNFESPNACNWWVDKWPWDQTNGQADPTKSIPFCMQEIDKSCKPESWQTKVKADCIKTTTTSCRRHADADAWYATITTMPMDFFLMYVPTETGNNHQLSEFDNIQVCAGAQCNPIVCWGSAQSCLLRELSFSPHQESWVPLDVSNFESLLGDSVVKSRACPLITASGDLRYGQCITMDSIRNLMTTESSENKCKSDCEWTSAQASNCVGNPAMASLSTTWSANGEATTITTQCTTTRTAACMQNSNSMSMPICQLLGGREPSDWGFPKCINAEFMRTQGLGSIFTEGSADFTTPTQDNHWIGLKLPTYLDDIVHIQTFFGAKHVCENDVGDKFATSTATVPAEPNQNLLINPINVESMRTDKTIISLHDRSIALRFKNDEWTCGPCEDKKGTDGLGYKFYPASGLARCRRCQTNVELRNPDVYDVGNRAYTKCEICPSHKYVTDSSQSQTTHGCSSCPDSTPYRPNPSTADEVDAQPITWNKCHICPNTDVGQPQMFDRSIQSPQSPCIGVPHFKLQVHNSALEVAFHQAGHSAEYYQISNDVTDLGTSIDWTTNGFAPLPFGSFLVLSNTATHLTKADCDDGPVDACGAFQYRSLCGNLFGGTDMYVKTQTGTELFLASEVSSSEIDDYSIQRQGKCMDCTPSSVKYFNGACSSTTNSPGFPTLCKTTTDSGCTQSQYLYHESQHGCEQEHARTDYECMKCPLVWIKDNSKYKIFIVVGCGIGATSFTRWHPHQNEQIGGVERPKSFECPYNLPSDDEDFTNCVHRGQPHALRNPAQRFWSSAGEEPGTALLPYCPTYWFVDTKSNHVDCSIENLRTATEYRPQCCKQCQSIIPGFMKGTDYEDCPGSSTEDLQRWVTSCPAGQYKDDAADADAGDDECKPCTVCGS